MDHLGLISSGGGGGPSQSYVDTQDNLRVLKAGDTMTGELATPGGIDLQGGTLYDSTGELSVSAGDVSSTRIVTRRIDAHQVVRPMEFVQGSKILTLFGAHTDSQTTLTVNSVGSGTNINSAFTNHFYPKTMVIQIGQADEEHVICPEPPVNVTFNRWQFSNVVRGMPFAAGVGQAHASGAAIRETDNQNYLHGWCLPVLDKDGNYTPLTYMGQSDTNDANAPIQVFLPPRIAIGTWTAPSIATGDNLSLFFIMRPSLTAHHVEIWEPYDGVKVIDFPSGTQAKYAEIMFHAQTGTYLYHSIVGGDLA